MNVETLKEAIRRELPQFLRTDPDLRAYILELTRQEYASRTETRDWFHDLLAELRHDREEQARKWDEQNRKWDEHQAEQREEFKNLYTQLQHDREEQSRRWEANQIELRRLHEEIMAQA